MKSVGPHSALDSVLCRDIDIEAFLTSDNSYLTDSPWGDGEAEDGWLEPDWYDDVYYEIERDRERRELEDPRPQQIIAYVPLPPSVQTAKPRRLAAPGYIKKAIPQKLRWQVFQRDGYICLECGEREDLTVDHIVAEVNGGPTTLENLRTLCRPCNSKKGAK